MVKFGAWPHKGIWSLRRGRQSNVGALRTTYELFWGLLIISIVIPIIKIVARSVGWLCWVEGLGSYRVWGARWLSTSLLNVHPKQLGCHNVHKHVCILYIYRERGLNN